jgi:Ca2+-binding RTX toxin-like protein
MRRVTTMLVALAVMVPLFAAAAYAATIEGTSEGEILQESNKNDTILARAGNDTILAQRFPGTVSATSPADTDVGKGNLGNDAINVKDGDPNDTAAGGEGTDTCYGDVPPAGTPPTAANSDEFLNCESINPTTPPAPE